MSVVEQLLAGLELTLIGMVTVFLLLTFMVLLIGWMSKLAQRLEPPARVQSMTGPAAPRDGLDPNLVSAISAAVHRYRGGRR